MLRMSRWSLVLPLWFGSTAQSTAWRRPTPEQLVATAEQTFSA